jgi:hypothetical protein
MWAAYLDRRTMRRLAFVLAALILAPALRVLSPIPCCPVSFRREQGVSKAGSSTRAVSVSSDVFAAGTRTSS